MAIEFVSAVGAQPRLVSELYSRAVTDPMSPDEQATRIAIRHAGDPSSPELMEIVLIPNAIVEPHSHSIDEIIVIRTGQAHFGNHILTAGASAFIPARTTYSFRAGPQGVSLLAFRPAAGSTMTRRPSRATNRAGLASGTSKLRNRKR